MRGLFPYYVETFDVTSRRQTVGEFRHLRHAVGTARRALDSPRCVLAVVKTDAGVMVYAVDSRREWVSEGGEIDRIACESVGPLDSAVWVENRV